MKLIIFFAVISITLGFKAKRFDRWIMVLLVALLFLNICYAYISF